MNYSLLRNLSLAGFLLLVFSACGPDNMDISDLDKDDNDPDVVICNMSVELVESFQTTVLLNSIVTDGTQPYSYLWSTGETTQEITPNSDGWYSIEVTDVEGCVANDSFEVIEINWPCNGLSNTITEQPPGSGNLYSSVTGGTPPYTYTWFPNIQSTQDIVATSSGWHGCTIMDDLGCLIVDTVYVVLDNPCNQFDAVIGETPAGSGNLEASILFGGTPPFSYLWSTGETTNVIVAPENGFYSVTVTDSEGCLYGAGYNVTLGADPCSMFNVVLAEQPPGSGAIYSQVIGGTAPFSYLWSTMETTPNIEVNSVGEYVLTVTDDEGCITSTTIEI